VTFVNPRPYKGLEVALRVAALLPQRRFLFIDGWPVRGEERAALQQRLQALPNVRLERRVQSMRSVYGRTAVLLVPSQCEDASPRVILEAQVSGIRIVASRTGGIPELLGTSGELCEPTDPPERWAEAIERAVLLGERPEGALASIENATRPEFGPEVIAESFLRLAHEHVARSRREGH
jgi:glycosyltransferase involved in cell wall biosynthesis